MMTAPPLFIVANLEKFRIKILKVIAAVFGITTVQYGKSTIPVSSKYRGGVVMVR